MNDFLILDRLKIYRMKMRLKKPFETSFGVTHDRVFLLVEVIDANGVSGWGESVAMAEPWYNEETCVTNEHMILDFLLPLVMAQPFSHPRELVSRFGRVRRNMMAKSALEGALWDLYAKRKGMPLASVLGGVRKKVEAGVSIGIQPCVDDLLTFIDTRVKEGYKRIKIKIKPGWDIDVLKAVRARFPKISLMADANSAYSLDDMDLLKQLDQFNLTMVEQPLAHDDIVDHAVLQKELKTPVCLDESIHTSEDARKALSLGSCGIINVKIGRVGGLHNAAALHHLCYSEGIPVWCGGMLESGVGRAHNIAIATLPGFVLPSDTASSSHYWEEDIIEPEVVVNKGVVTVPTQPGIGFKVVRDKLEKYCLSVKDIAL